MKIAIVHELLTMRGGAERLTKVVADLFPDAPIYTLLYNEKKLGDWFPRERIRFSKLQKFAPFSTNHHLYLRHFPKAVEQWCFDEFDLVISFSSAFAHGIKTSGKTKHLCYVNSPARYLWDRTFDVQERVSQRFFGKLLCTYLVHTMYMLRQWDVETSERPDILLAASKEVQSRIMRYWRRKSTVLYPPVDISSFELNEGKRDDYYVIASTLVPYKRIDLAIEACAKLGRRLKIIGDGPIRKQLGTTHRSGRSRSSAAEGIEFLGYVSEEELRKQLLNARAFILPGEEDFGIAPIEAMACGTPVIAYGRGGALETIQEGTTGVFFQEQNVESLIKAIKDFESKTYNPAQCRHQAEKFSQEKFVEGLKRYIENM